MCILNYIFFESEQYGGKERNLLFALNRKIKPKIFKLPYKEKQESEYWYQYEVNTLHPYPMIIRHSHACSFHLNAAVCKGFFHAFALAQSVCLGSRIRGPVVPPNCDSKGD